MRWWVIGLVVLTVGMCIFVCVATGCVARRSVQQESIEFDPAGWTAQQIDDMGAVLAAAGVEPETIATVGEAMQQMGGLAPDPFGMLIRVVGGILVAGAGGWGAYQTKKKGTATKALKATCAAFDIAESLRNADGSPKIPSDALELLKQTLAKMQDINGTRQFIAKVRGKAK